MTRAPFRFPPIPRHLSRSVVLATSLVVGALAACSDGDPSALKLTSGGGAPGAGQGNTGNGVITTPAGYTAHALFRRISGTVYANTARDVFGVTTLSVADDLPEDALINDFDNAIEQPLAASHIQSYLTAAKKVADAALAPGNAKRASIFPCGVAAPAADPVACAKSTAAPLLRLLFRRAPTTDEINAHAAYVPASATTTATFTDAISSMVQAALLSPHYLYLVELGAGNGNAALTNYEYAARLAYALWSSAPDEALLAKAEGNKLSGDDAVRAEVVRMLDDPRGHAFAVGFAGQWLGVRFLQKSAPDAKVFPAFDEPLRTAMSAETLAYFEEMRTQNLPLSQLIESNFTFVNERLAAHYGIDGVKGADMRRVTVDGGKRGGILSQGMMLTTTSAPDHTSIVKRGKWVLGKLMCQTLPPPPPNVPSFTPVLGDGLTLREQIEAHRSNPACSGCHSVMDPVGFGLESYDAIGAYRTTDNGKPVDTTGVLPGGKTFSDAEGLGKILQTDERFTRCATSKLVMFGLGREPESDAEKASFEALLAKAGKTQFQLADLIVQFTASDLFRSVRVTKE